MKRRRHSVESSAKRLLGMVEALIKSGADIRLEAIFEEVKKKVAGLDKKIRLHRKVESVNY